MNHYGSGRPARALLRGLIQIPCADVYRGNVMILHNRATIEVHYVFSGFFKMGTYYLRPPLPRIALSTKIMLGYRIKHPMV